MKSLVDKVRHGLALIQGDATQDMTYESQRSFPDEATARLAFGRSVDRLLRVEEWSGLSSFAADFTIYDPAGKPKPTGFPEVDDYILIALPGPLPENWVRVTERVMVESRAAFTVRPSANPQENKPGEIAHFFDQRASSTFQVERVGTTLIASEIGRNEGINNDEPQAGNRGVINTVIAETGWLFYQQLQWKLLTDYLIDV